MKRENTIKQNVEFLLEQYKLDLEYLKNQNQKDFDATNLDQAIWDDENVIMELETILEFANGKV